MSNEGVVANNTTNFKLGKPTTDEADNCITTSNTPIKNRRVGTCTNSTAPTANQVGNALGGDGLYTILARNIDTAGNRGGWVQRTVERDTVAPASPVVQTSTTNGVRSGVTSSKFGQWLNLALTGEAFTTASVIVSNDQGRRIYREYKLSSDGTFSKNDIIGKLDCGGVNYSIEVYLKDRAGNISIRTIQENFLKTDVCGACTTSGSGIMQLPVDEGTIEITGRFPKYQAEYGDPHAGRDFASKSGLGGQNIYASDSGAVTKSYYGYTDNYSLNIANGRDGRLTYAEKYNRGWANLVIIDHGNGYQTIYAHLQPESTPIVTVGQSVTKGQVIGKMGSTGASTGHHLHFQVEKEGAPLNPLHAKSFNRWPPIDPGEVLSTTLTNYTPEEEAVSCQIGTIGTGEDDLPLITEDEAREAAAKYIIENLNDESYIERHDGRITSSETNPAITDTNNPDHYTKEYTKKGELGDNKNNLDFMKKFVDIYQIKTSIWPHNMREVDEKKNGEMTQQDKDNRNYDSYDSGIVVNNYNVKSTSPQKAFLIKNGIWDKYYNSPIETIGVPTNEETPGGTKNTVPQTNATSAWWQGFQTGGYPNNRIFNTNAPGQVGGISPKYLVSRVANHYNDKGDIHTFGYPLSDTYKGCAQDFETVSLELCVDIEETLTIRQSRSDTGGILKNGNLFNSNGDVQDRNNRKVRLSFVDPNNTGDENKYRYGYKDDKNVWIISHGWNDGPNSFTEMSNNIKSQNPNDIVLLLDWSEASHNYGNCIFAIATIENCPDGVYRAATWIGPTADEVTNLLKKWGLNNRDKLRVSGHSLGSIMSGEISQKMGGAQTLIALDPPSEQQGKYKVYKNPFVDRQNFTQYAQFSRSFVGARSFAGNHDFARTANEAFVMDFGDFSDLGSEHFDVVKTFNRMLAANKVYNNYLDSKDLSRNNNFYNDTDNGFEGRIFVNGRDNADYIRTANDLYGTSIQNSNWGASAVGYTYYGAGGNDEFPDWGRTDITAPSKVQDFEVGDRLVVETKFTLPTSTVTNTPTRVEQTCGVGPGCPIGDVILYKTSTAFGGEKPDILVKGGGGRGTVNQTQLNNALNGNSNTPFIFRNN